MVKTLCVLLFGVTMALANSDLAFADSCYAARAERSSGDKADPKNAALMKDAYRRAMQDQSVLEKAMEGYVKSYYYSFRFVPFDKKKRKLHLDSLKTITESAYGKFPGNKEIAHIYATTLSMWGAEKNPLTAVKEGVANRVRDIATASNDYQVLGRAHQLLPYIPIILSWPDKALADKYLTMALEKDPKDLYNYFFLAELRFDQKRYADALNLIDRGLSRGIRTSYFLEDKRGRWQLKELQKKINAKLDKKK
ncbi:hypothetical protein [Fibrobacter sp. UBA4309]|uniref:hypothetical protein n=1 Tax=Fibrobacter sp. UBA4309 TaxID=1946537 RepID=UPI0025BC2DB6|nr:hypothetical protein [Fibrobacter sp. UBA4309]